VSESAAMEQRRETVQVDDRVLQIIDLALDEDRGAGDWTSRWTVSARTRVHARIIAKADGVVAGLMVAKAVFRRLDPRVEFEFAAQDGARIAAGDVLCSIRGPGRTVLTGERTALNFLQRLSGIASLTRRFVDAVDGTGVRILDTRKTTPAWRALEKAAVRAGGGENHRAGLYDAVLIKENHIMVAGGIAEALQKVHDQNTRGLPVIVEVRSVEEATLAADNGADRLLLDNMETPTIKEIVRLVRRRSPRPELEASGNMSLARVPEVAATGVDFISVGALTHSAPALDLSLEVDRL
jgi:nicotinate-nucleotide pyrophosphorylase (carboxylating)